MNDDKDSKLQKDNEILVGCPADELCYDFPNNGTLNEYNTFVIQKPQVSVEEEISEIKYHIIANDNAGTKLVKSLINLIYAYEKDLVNHIRKIGKSYKFQIKMYESKFQRFEGNIGMKNVAKLLGISYSNFKKNWAQHIENKVNINFYFKSFFKVFHATNKYFPENIKIFADSTISDYLDAIGLDNDLRIKISVIFNNYVDIPISFTDISFLLGKSYTYLNILSEKLKMDLEFEHIKKYFNLLSNIFFLNPNNFIKNNIKLKNSKLLNELKEKCYNLIFNIMVEHEILSVESYGEFDVIFYSFLAIAEMRGDSFNINDFSRLITDNVKGVLFSEKLKGGWRISIEQCKIMKKLIPLSSKYSEKAEELIDNYIEYRESLRASEYPIYWWDEDVIRVHCTVLAIRDFCIDVINLDATIPESFIKTYPLEWYTFNRHHIYRGQKKSINPNQLTLPMLKNHPSQEGKTELIKELLIWRFKGIKEIPTYYQNIKKGGEKWLKYLTRREYIEKNGIGFFILKYLTNEEGRNHFIERFYPKVLDKRRKNIFYLTERDKKEIVANLEKKIKKVFSDWVDKYPRLIPRLPKYAKYILPKQMRIFKYFNF